MIKYEKKGFEQVFDRLGFVDGELDEFLGLDLAYSFLESRNYRIDVFGLALDFLKLGVEESRSVVGEFPHLVPLNLNLLKIGLALDEFLLKQSEIVLNR